MALEVEAKAKEAATLLGIPGFTSASVNMLPCEGDSGEGDGVYAAHGAFQLDTGAEALIADMERLQVDWTAKGFKVTPMERFSDGGARVTAADEAGDWEYSAISTAPPSAIALYVTSPCFNASDPDSNYLYAPSTPLLPAPSAT